MRAADAEVARLFLTESLTQTKTRTIKAIYERLNVDDADVTRSFMNPGGTETGRFNHAESFLDPSTNLANLPNKTAALDPLYAVRDCIIPHTGRLLGKADYSQAEARWCAWMARDEVRMRYFAEGIDQYRLYVSIYKHDDDRGMAEVTPMERQAIGKVGVLSGQYGVGWKTILANVNKDADITGVAIDAKGAKKMEAIIPEIFPRTPIWWEEIREQVLSKGWLTNPFGRKRLFYGRQDGEHARDKVVREAIAFGPQSANADMVNTAIRRLYTACDGTLIRLLLQCHDEIVFDCAPRDGMAAARTVKEAMEFEVEVEGVPLIIPVEVKLSSRNWRDMKEIAC